VVLVVVAFALLTRLFGIPVEVAPGIWDSGTLGTNIGVCGRTYHRGPDIVTSTRAEIVARDQIEPLAVAPGRCTPGACTREPSAGPCHTVVYVRVADDAYVEFALRGGP
jgi:hypothetical protein